MACGPILGDNMARPTDLVLTQSSGWSVEISKRWADPDLLLFAVIGSHSVEWAEVYFGRVYCQAGWWGHLHTENLSTGNSDNVTS